jgi:hypothetical protein
MTIQEIEQCYGINSVSEVFRIAHHWQNRLELLSYFKNNSLPWDAECLEMLIKYNFLNVTR